MKLQHLGKWSTFCAVAALFAASGGGCPPATCPPGQSLVSGVCTTPPTPPSLTGLWLGSVTGDVTTTTTTSAVPPNPNPTSRTDVNHLSFTVQPAFNDSGLPVSPLPLPVSGLGFFFFQGSSFQTFFSTQLTAFHVGETQIFTNSTTTVTPSGAAGTTTQVKVNTTTLTVTASALAADHFRVVYAFTHTPTNNTTSTTAGTLCNAETESSSGTLIFEATATDGLLNFSMELNNAGTWSDTTGNSPCPPASPTTTSASGTLSGKLVGTLARD